MIANNLPLHPTTIRGQKLKNPLFSEYGHVAHQIKGNGECSNIQTNSLSLHAPSTAGVGSRSKPFFLKVVILHFKLMGMEHRAPITYSVFTHTIDPWVGSKGQNIFFY